MIGMVLPDSLMEAGKYSSSVPCWKAASGDRGVVMKR